MKNTRKILIALFIVVTLLVSVFAINVSAATAANTTIYLKPNANWVDSNAWFAVYTWDVSPNWYKMTDNDGDGLYECTLPAGVTNVIFCRMNPASATLDWPNKWDQTVDLQYTGKNCFTVKEGDWNNATGTWSDFTPTHTHSWVKGADTPATCTEAGAVNYSCSCGGTKQDAIPALHASLNGVCSVCGFDTSKASVLYLKNTAAWTLVQCYSWDGKGADNTWPGVAMTLVDGDVYMVEIPAGFINIIFHNKVDAGEGMYEGTQTADLLVPANGCIIFDNSTNTWAEYHNPETVEGKAPTCKDPGYTESSKCSDCGKVLKEAEEIGVSGEHTYESEIKAPTCTETGLNTFTCSVCGDSYTEEIPTLDHTYDESIWGYKGADGHAHTCSCGAKDAINTHTPNADAPTEDTAKYCVDCGYVIEAALGHVCNISELKYDADGHWYKCTGCEATSEKSAHTGGEATCTEPAKCTTCEQPYGKALGHTWTDATCTAPKTCSACGTTDGEALGHTFTDATCTAPKTCSVCGTTDGEALGHTFTDATCTAPKTCSVCGATDGEAKGHSFADATCTAPKTCSVCGATEGKALGHSFVEGKCSCGATDPDYVPEVDDNPAEPELSFFEKIWQAILAFIQKILGFFK